jgi:hypothetical protein
MFNRIKRNTGVTLLELLIASIIGVITTAAAVELYVHQHKGWLMQENLTDQQQNGRAGVDEIADKSRMAGYKTFPGMEAIISSKTVGSSIPDSITLVFLHEPVCTASLSSPMPLPSAELKCVGSNLSCFWDGQWCYIYDPFADEGEFFVITHVQGAAMHIQHNTMPLSKVYPAGSELYTFDLYRYFIDNWSDTLHPRLMRQEFNFPADIYADNISDMQIRYVMADGSVLDTINMSSYVRQINIDLVARTKKKDLMANEYRSDTLTTSVQVRNLGF